MNEIAPLARKDLEFFPVQHEGQQFVHRINKIADRNGLPTDDKEKVLKVLELINSVLGVMDFASPVLGQEVEALIEKRNRPGRIRIGNQPIACARN